MATEIHIETASTCLLGVDAIAMGMGSPVSFGPLFALTEIEGRARMYTEQRQERHGLVS